MHDSTPALFGLIIAELNIDLQKKAWELYVTMKFNSKEGGTSKLFAWKLVICIYKQDKRANLNEGKIAYFPGITQKRGIKPVSHDVCDYMPGIGIRCEIGGHEILVGSGKLMNKFSVAPDEVKRQLEKMKKFGLTIVFIAKDNELAGILGFANHQRPGVDRVLQFFENDGVNEIAMVTGDSKYTALDLSERLNIKKCYYSVMPEEKANIIRELRKDGSKILMVGDGINDALALAEADIGIAMGTGGSEVAIEAADIALVGDDINGLIYIRSLSHATIRIVHQNFWIATGSNLVGVILGAMGILSPVMAGLIHITHTAGILANSGRLLFYEEPPVS